MGEGTRCWFGNQFSLIAPRFAAYGVDLWVPELGGRFDARNSSHTMLMSVLGGFSDTVASRRPVRRGHGDAVEGAEMAALNVARGIR